MNKKIIIANLTTLLVTGAAFAAEHHTPTNPAAQPNTAAQNKLAYGCIGSGDGQFQGKIGCEGQIIGGCEADPTPCGGTDTEHCDADCSADPQITPPCGSNNEQ